MAIEDFGPELVYIKGNDNVVADAMRSHLQKKVPDLYTIADYYGIEQLSEGIYHVQLKLLQAEQQKDKKLLKKAKPSNANYKVKNFLGCDQKYQLMCLNNKIVVLTSLQRRIVEWYHERLCHPGLARTEATIRQHFIWKN
eukprot:12152654-Ditylum_brightwellii.AAC.1